MAAQVPAKDVLCEAMEYLSKLGSNLRTRSENLKEKKIRKEKLNNVLAVQKAASKVLLICELSKKSLDNVETGVRKVLELIDASQASSSDGGKRSKTESDSVATSKYFLFEYKSRKLRIKKRISLKHYTSVRVVAKSMPKLMMDNYPVHYDCKLYRMRNRERKVLKLKDVSETHTKTGAKEGLTSPQIEKSLCNDMSIISIPDSPISKSIPINKTMDTSGAIPDKEQPRKSSVDLEKERSHKDQSPQKNKLETRRDSEKQRSKDGAKNFSEKEKRRSSGGNKIKNRKNSEADNKCDDESAKKKLRKLRLIEDSSDDEKEINRGNETVQPNIEASKTNDTDESAHEPNHKKRKLNDEVRSKSNDLDTTSSTNSDENKSGKNKDHDAENESIKPVIKCVSLSKLLKPDIIKKDTVKLNSKMSEDSSNCEKKSKDSEDKIKRKTEKLARKEKEDEEYWVQKRNEVSSFKPKKLAVNVTRLPELSLDFLNKLKLKKITQNDIIILEALGKSSGQDEGLKENSEIPKLQSGDGENIIQSCESRLDPKRASLDSSNSNDDDLIAEANKVKNSLLHESDSDENGIGSDNEKSTCTKDDTGNVKNDSDLEPKTSDDRSLHHSKNAKKAPCDKSDHEYERNKSRSTSPQAEVIKNKLLADSNSESDGKTSDSVQNKEMKKKHLNNSDSGEDTSLKLVFSTDSEKQECEANAKNGEEKTSAADGSNIEKGHSEGSSPENLIEKNDENIAQCQRNEKTPEKASLPSGNSVEKAKSSLLNDSPDDKIKTPLSQRMTPQSRKKRMMESMRAKKMLLTYSSSDTEDEQLKEALKEIKDSLLHVSDEENGSKKHETRKSSTSSSDDEVLKKVKKHRRLDSQDSIKDGSSTSSKSSSRKMVRSKSKPGNSSSQISDDQDSNDKDIDGLTNLNTLNKTKARRNSNDSDTMEESGSSKSKSGGPKTTGLICEEMLKAESSSDSTAASGEENQDDDGKLEFIYPRNSNDSDLMEESGSSKSKSGGPKTTGLICEEMLKAESSSDSTAASGEENQDDDDLPEVAVPSFNGDHLVKEDLLAESDSSASHNESPKKDDSEEDEKLNSKRRKAIAISSDSEVGSSRKKDADVRLSDFEDSDDSTITKRTKKKKKATDSDASGGSNSSNEGGKKKRRRIKSVRDSDASGSESETEGRNKHGRKNIRKVMGKNQLEEATKKAAREEKERIARIAERQKMYNNMEFDESGKPDEVVLDKVVLDFDPETKEPLIEVDRGLVKKLKPHQANGIKFMWDACFESAKRIKKDRGSGCILAHCMGLGKTLQVVTLTHTLLTHGDLTRVNRVLVVCPLSTVLNWVNEFKMWLKYAETEYEVDVYELSRFKQNSERAFQLSQWFQYGGVCVLGYEMFRNLSADNSKKFKKKMLKSFQEALVDPGPDLVVCDEGHLLKNEKTSLSQSMNRVKTHRRIVLTGTPLQNNLKEYYCMVQFVKPNLLGKYNEYLNRFVNPITNGQYTDSTEHDIKIMKRRSHVLHKMLDGAVQRRDYGVLAPFLPPKHEYVLFITLSEVQTKLYQHYLENFSRRPQPGKSSGFLFPDFQSLQRIWTHPLVLKYNSERYEIMQQKKRDKEEEDSEGSLVDFIDDDSTPDESTTEESTDELSDVSDDSRKKSKKKKSSKKNKSKDKDKDIKGEGQSRPRRGTRANPIEIDDDQKEEDMIVESRNENPTEWWIKLVVDEELDDMRNSHKLVLLFEILRQCETIGDKLLVFSQSLYSLDLIEHFLGKVDEATQEGRIDEKLGGHVGSWSPGVDYFRLDGSTSCENRSIWCKNFNREDNPRARLFLISTRAGGLGINLVAANRVVIFDVSWNPSHDVQSIFRVYRFGQKKPCYVYRFLAMGTMEEKIYERQVTKQAISKRVIDEQQIDRHYAENDLAELYKFEPQPPTPRPIPPLPKDRLFAEMLREHEAQIYKYHEHDSLLENKEEETLSEEERKAAWEDFENEKNKPPPAPFPSPWPMHNGMVPGLLQQQQLAYAALAAMLRKDMPNLNDNQLRDMLPLICNANPQLMQKMSEIYKYTQPGMMNPAMMNPAMMGAAGGAGALGGLGGASGLQYEPPWQRQQQQQQQMRLQQMMQQQQNQMGAKFYAGGLGSRDPVAMALQQQRAREIMLGGGAGAGAGRPRGRPPLQPRAPITSDVVNLDSD